MVKFVVPWAPAINSMPLVELRVSEPFVACSATLINPAPASTSDTETVFVVVNASEVFWNKLTVPGALTTGPSFTGFTVIETVATDDVAKPSLTRNVKLSPPE